jgi:hypothetical protein
MRVHAPDALCVGADGRLFVSSGANVLMLSAWGASLQLYASFSAPVTALAASPSGRIAVAWRGGLAVCDRAGQRLDGWQAPHCPVSAALFLSEDELALADPGYRDDEPMLPLATWDETARGAVVCVRASGEPRTLASGLACPMGLALDPQRGLVAAEFERARLVDSTGLVRRAGYPGYLGRVSRTERGYLLACLSRRDPLIEFLKTERAFVADMKASVPPSHWIAPRLDPGFRHDFPIELGATRLFGEIKPWAPSFSYGLLLELDGDFTPLGSWQSRAHGRRHAISDAVAWNGDIFAVSRASGELLNLGRAS